ncbi:hypothetical protein [Nocardia sp. NPDC050175]|uniref:hypothetical protein n=1 Tax=Nocardia sp. NPDC050175 TaxID=3364317 RepID=UPI00379444EB
MTEPVVAQSYHRQLAAVLLADATAGQAREQHQRLRADEAEARRRRADVTEQEQRRKAQGRRENDYAAMVFAALICLTVLGPYLIGHFAIRRTSLLAPDLRVFDGAVRGLTDHFGPDYLAGAAAVTAVLAVFLLVRPWSFRVSSVVIGWALVAGLVAWLLPLTTTKWHDAEQTSVTKLASTAFPFNDRFYSCDGYRYSINWSAGAVGGARSEVWQIYLSQAAGFAGGCNRIDVYNGWQRVGVFTTGDGDTFLSGRWANTDISVGVFYLNTIWVSVPTRNGGTMRFTLEGAQHNEFLLSYG